VKNFCVFLQAGAALEPELSLADWLGSNKEPGTTGQGMK
jgi:hypothetical protein